ncbi:molybdopterin-dependent oxidoreductase [candidate division WOR-3 bacterium]|nr:molybdopterin-dependent oxidoreductase [candidate division WOR-3 bacterium]
MFKRVKKSERKIDAIPLGMGEPMFTDDIELKNPLYLAMLYSPIPHGEIVHIDTKDALNMEGVVDVLTYKNTPDTLFTTAGQGYPEPSPYDTRLFDKRVRFAGDRVALVAAESPELAREALKRIRVEYRELPAVFDTEEALKGEVILHDGDEHMVIPAVYKPEKNIAAEIDVSFGNPEKGLEQADIVIERDYSVQIASHSAIEPHASVAYIDEMGRLVIVTSTQVPFHVRRIVSMVLGIPVRKIRVIKPRVGGGFGGKQEVILEPYVALITWKHRRPSRFVFTREEVFFAGRTRHGMKLKLTTGVKKTGEITTLIMDAVMNAGAYGPHSLTVLSNTGSKVLPLFNKIENLRFHGRTVYTNLPVGGAYRGYGATQGYAALGQHIDIICDQLGLDILDYYRRWHIKEGETSRVFEVLGEGKEGVKQVIHSCKLDECIDRGAEAIGWYEKRRKRIKIDEDRYLGVGMACAMQGSAIPEIDMGSAYMKMNDDGSFNLHIGATDLGTGSDTILAQIAAEVLDIPVEMIIVRSSDTDITPFDVGAYASSTTYLSGEAVRRCAEDIKGQILKVAGEIIGESPDGLDMYEGIVSGKNGKVSFRDIALYSLYQKNQFQIQATASAIVHQSPPPFIAQFAEVEVDVKTGIVKVRRFVSAVDCGTPINPRLAEGQVEGAVLNGISYALVEDYLFDEKGRMTNPNFRDYKIFTTLDLPEIITIIVNSYEETGPFGAKSIAEVGINGPIPAIANAIYDAIGVRVYHAPFTPERVFRAIRESGKWS